MTNKEVVLSFLNGKIGKNTNMFSGYINNDLVLLSYSTAIAQWHDGKLHINICKYSRTTSSKHQSPLFKNMYEYVSKDNIIVHDYVSRCTSYLID